jgi:membrane dipeptidase
MDCKRINSSKPVLQELVMRFKMLALLLVSTAAVFGLMSCAGEDQPAAEELRAEQIHAEALTVDTHCDTPMLMVGGKYDMGEYHASSEERRGRIDLPRMQEGGLDAEFFAAFVGQGPRTPEGYAEAESRARKAIEAVHQMCADYPEMVALATSPDDAVRLEEEGKIAAYIGMENGYPIGKEISMVKAFYDLGVRYITLCHSSDNDICDSSTDRLNPEDEGLSEFGKRVVDECNRLGIMVDISHASDQSFYDVLEQSQAPVIASHSSCRALCGHPRNLTDDMIKALAEKGGVIQICFVSSFVRETPPNPEQEKALAALEEKYGSYRDIEDEEILEKLRQEARKIYEKYPSTEATVYDVIDHVDHVVELVGADHVGFGTDFDGGGGVEGCNDVSEMPNLTRELLKRGYTEEDIIKIWGGNVLRVFQNVADAAQNNQ